MFPSSANWLTDEKNILVGGKPRDQVDLDKILNLGITVFINLMSNGEVKNKSNFKYHLTNNNIEFYHYPIRDHSTLDDTTMLSIADKIILLSENNKIYIHCRGGHGRTGILSGIILHKIWNNDNIIDTNTRYLDILEHLRKGHSARTYNKSRDMPGTAVQHNQLYRIITCETNIFFYQELDINYIYSNYFYYKKGKKKGQCMFVDDEGIKWQSTEAYYQAYKYKSDSEESKKYFKLIQECDTPYKAFLLGRQGGNIRPPWVINKSTNSDKIKDIVKKYKQSVSIREDWDNVKDNIMYKAIKYKFTQNIDLRNQLLTTGNIQIHEYTKRDNYWGIYHTKKSFIGEDKLGILLSKLKLELNNNYTSLV
uniref:NADAR domain protein n=1 Tax=Pithovirus LCPAC101 TaxID=2506586 RepID=A0A481Z467_9VIRU|nr:MAG: NADAR domain protein [Pithovirus LCPAC101]